MFSQPLCTHSRLRKHNPSIARRALVVQRIGRKIADLVIEVRFFAGAQLRAGNRGLLADVVTANGVKSHQVAVNESKPYAVIMRDREGPIFLHGPV